MQATTDPSVPYSSFKEDVLQGLTATPKHLYSKYFYDKEGDRLFQKIMHCPEYYLTDCELEILSRQAAPIIAACLQQAGALDLVELGPGDAFKSVHLLKALSESQGAFHYFPIDISGHVVQDLEQKLPDRIKDITVKGMPGEYLNQLAQVKEDTSKSKLVLFLGSSLGNMNLEASLAFLKKLKSLLNPGDFLLMGLDLVKAPEIILNAYNDKGGYTKAFNMNLLERINRELGGHFKPDLFTHFPVFDRNTHTCKSYLLSLIQQEITVADHVISFQEREAIFMEISQKYDDESIKNMLQHTGFTLLQHFHDRRKWFVDTLWQA